MPGLRRQDLREEIQKGEEVLWLRQLSGMHLYDMGYADPGRLPEMRQNPAEKSGTEREDILFQ